MKKFIFQILVILINLNSYGQWIKTQGPYGIIANAMSCNDSLIFIGCDNGVYKASNLGNSWEKTSLDNIVNCIFVDSALIIAGTDMGIYFSYNNGDDWEYKNFLGDVTAIYKTGDTIFIGTDRMGIHYTINEGINWVDVSQYLPLWDHIQIDNFIKVGQKLYAISKFGGLYYCNNFDWIWLNDVSNPNNGCIDIKTHNGILFWNSYDKIFSSDDFGNTWTEIYEMINNSHINNMAFKNDTIFLATDNGIKFSINNGATWADLSMEIINNCVTNLSFIKNKYILTTKLRGFMISSDNGLLWSERNNGLTEVGIKKFINKNNELIAHSGIGIFKKNSNDDSWININNNLLEYYISNSLINDSLFIVVLSNGVYKSHNQGNTLSNSSNGININNDLLANSICVFDTTIYLCSMYNGVFCSYDSGNSWGNKDIGIIQPTYIECNSSAIFAINSNGVYRSYDNCNSWEQRLNNSAKRIYTNGNTIYVLTDQSVLVSYNNGNSWDTLSPPNNTQSLSSVFRTHGLVFINTYKKVFTYNEFDSTWADITNNLIGNFNYIYSIYEFNNEIFLSTDTYVWKANLSDFVSSPSFFYNAELQLYPNPGNGKIKINNLNSNCKVKIYNSLGKEVLYSIISKNENSIELSLSKSIKGIYYIEINTFRNNIILKYIIH